MASKRTYKKKGSRKQKGSRRHHRKHAKKNMIVVMGGDGGSTGYAAGVYGGIGQQHAQSDDNNVIAMNAQYANSMRGGADIAANQGTITGLSPATLVNGAQQQQLQKGGEVLTEVAVPVALLALNQGLVPKRRTGKQRHHRSNKRYRR